MTAKNNKSLKILLVDDHPLLRQGIKQVVEGVDDFVVCAEASSASEAMKIINKNKPDFAIVDVSLGGSINGIELVRSIRERYPDINMLVLSMHEESLYAERAIRAGARGYIMKEVAPGNIVDAIQTILAGELYLSEGLSKKIIDKLVHGSVDTDGLSIEVLSNRELEVFQLIGNGFTTKEISKKLNISIYTVETHKRNIKKKLRLSSSSEITRHAIQWVISQTR